MGECLSVLERKQLSLFCLRVFAEPTGGKVMFQVSVNVISAVMRTSAVDALIIMSTFVSFVFRLTGCLAASGRGACGSRARIITCPEFGRTDVVFLCCQLAAWLYFASR